VGPLTRSVRDAARVLGVIAGADPDDATASAEPVPDYEAAIGKPIKGMRVGFATGYFMHGIDEDVARAVKAASAIFGFAGATVDEIDPPGLEEINAAMSLIISSEASAYHANWLRSRPEDYSPQVRARLEAGLGIGAVQYLEAQRARAGLVTRFCDAVFGKFDALLAPVLRFPVPTIAETDIGGGPKMGEMLSGFTRYTRPINYLGLPALSLPCGFDAAGLPIGFQLVGRPFAEATLFQLGAAYETATDWHRKAPHLPA
jgi:aspartyl-tRNA(Asn)/glutamyl-tRNA(Gln) amidotransferase subunit A